MSAASSASSTASSVSSAAFFPFLPLFLPPFFSLRFLPFLPLLLPPLLSAFFFARLVDFTAAFAPLFAAMTAWARVRAFLVMDMATLPCPLLMAARAFFWAATACLSCAFPLPPLAAATLASLMMDWVFATAAFEVFSLAWVRLPRCIMGSAEADIGATTRPPSIRHINTNIRRITLLLSGPLRPAVSDERDQPLPAPTADGPLRHARSAYSTELRWDRALMVRPRGQIKREKNHTAESVVVPPSA